MLFNEFTNSTMQMHCAKQKQKKKKNMSRPLSTGGEFFFPEEFRPSHYLVW